ncbi:MAG TPA: hypothetical protein VLA34_14440, partial [Candidatus Krumholzibacterium sp.]|nr:hypothetical protein [Candidatus Krumholzibacterium sp.]
MPIYLDETEVVQGADAFRSVLIVPCRFCPAASMAIREQKPYVRLLSGSFKTEPYERLIGRIKRKFEGKGIRTKVFRSSLLHQFVLCTWTSRRRQKLSRVARKYDALLVLGCEGALRTVNDIVGPGSCTVLAGMRSEGVMSIVPRLSFPCDISL